MCSVFDRPICLTGNHSDNIALFDKKEDFERFQLHMGLQNLCQNTLFYPNGKDDHGKTIYEQQESPHSKAFYNDACIRFRTNQKNAIKCDKLMQTIAIYFCEKKLTGEFSTLDYKLFPYNRDTPDECYIRYKCPYVGLYKFAFPIYVNGFVIAVLFTGQFSILPHPKSIFTSGNFGILNFMRQSPPAGNISFPEPYTNNSYASEDELMEFVENNLLKVVSMFTIQARHNLVQKQIELLNNIIEAQAFRMEDAVVTYLTATSKKYGTAERRATIQKRFWQLIAENLKPYLEQICANTTFLFMEPQHTQKIGAQKIHGIQLYPELKQNCDISFDFQHIQRREPNNDTIYSLDQDGRIQHIFLFDCINSQDEMSFKKSDIFANAEKIQPFAVLIDYSENIHFPHDGFVRRSILEQLKFFCTKVEQELAYLSIRMSEHITKTALRIYRHELIHIVDLLEENNLFLDIEQLQKTDENKLRRVAEDQQQCIFELGFITKNINVVTGTINKQVSGLFKEEIIDVSSKISNKAISLYQQKKEDKTLWFSIQNFSNIRSIKSNPQLLDTIFFNFMTNAIKYSYPGTKIIIGFEDTEIYDKPFRIRLTDFGTAVIADYHDQVFQLYYRGNESSHIDGAGIGLYVANAVAEILGASLSWRCNKISDYNIPMLMRFMKLPPETQNSQNVVPSKLYDEYQRLVETHRLSQIFNPQFLNDYNNWDTDEIFGELMNPTYEVTFAVEL